jgi:hypothetical protein
VEEIPQPMEKARDKAAKAVGSNPRYVEAKERQRLSEGRGQKGKELFPDLNAGQARDSAAKAVGTNRQYVSGSYYSLVLASLQTLWI